MNHPTLLACVAASILPLCGGFDGISPKRSKSTMEQQKAVLSAEDSRRALIRLAGASDEMLIKRSVPYLKKDPVTVEKNHTISIGRWKIEAANHKFHFSIIAPPDILLECFGNFEKDANGKWVAKIKTVRQQ